MRYRRTTTTMLVCAAVLLVGLGASPGVAAAAPSPGALLEPHGVAVFEWHRLSQVNARVSDQRLAALSAEGFKTVYADVGEYLEVADQPYSRTQQNRLGQLRSDLKLFVARAAKQGLAVHAVGGGPNWTDETHRYLGPFLLDLVADYNGGVLPNERLKGVQFDIEPYVEDSFWDNVELALQRYLVALRDIVAHYRDVRTREGNGGLRLGFAIPFWFDGNAPDVPEVWFGDPTKLAGAAFHLIDLLHDLSDAYVLVMAYRNFTAGEDGSIAHVQDEVTYATTECLCGIVIGQEFAKVYPQKLSFWWKGRAAFWQAADELATTYGGGPSFRGLSVNDLSAYQAAPA